jgi:hypothetical protein
MKIDEILRFRYLLTVPIAVLPDISLLFSQSAND